MNWLRLMATGLGVFSAMAMEQRPPAGSGAPSGPSGAVVLANKLYEETRFLGSGELSPRSEHERFYESIRERLEARDAAEVAYRLALIYDKNRPARDIIPLLERVLLADGAFDQRKMVDARYRLACLYAQSQVHEEWRIRDLLQSSLTHEELLSPESAADAKQKLAFLCARGRGCRCNRELALKLFQEVLGSGYLKEGELGDIWCEIARLHTMKLESDMLQQLMNEAHSNRELYAYAAYKLAIMYLRGEGLSQDIVKAKLLLGDAIKGGALSAAQDSDARVYFLTLDLNQPVSVDQASPVAGELMGRFGQRKSCEAVIYESMLKLKNLAPEALAIVHCRLLNRKIGSSLGDPIFAIENLSADSPLRKDILPAAISEYYLRIGSRYSLSDGDKRAACQKLLCHSAILTREQMAYVYYRFGMLMSKDPGIRSDITLKGRAIEYFEEVEALVNGDLEYSRGGKFRSKHRLKAQRKLAWLRALRDREDYYIPAAVWFSTSS